MPNRYIDGGLLIGRSVHQLERIQYVDISLRANIKPCLHVPATPWY